MITHESVETAVRVASALSFCQIPAMAAAPRMLKWGDQLASLDPLSRRIIHVIGVAIILVVQGTGVVGCVGAADIASGTALGTAYSGFAGLFWAYRASIQSWAYRPLWPANCLGRASHVSLVLLFWTQATIFIAVCLRSIAGIR